MTIRGTHIARFDRGAFGAKPNCSCGHPWSNHIIPGGVDNIDIYPNQRHCVDCACRDYTEPVRSDEAQEEAERVGWAMADQGPMGGPK